MLTDNDLKCVDFKSSLYTRKVKREAGDEVFVQLRGSCYINFETTAVGS